LLFISSEEIFLKVRTQLNDMTIYNDRHIYAAVDDDFLVKKTPQGIFLYSGLSFRTDKSGNISYVKNYEETRNLLIHEDGCFCFAHIGDSKISCCRSFYRYCDIYYWQHGKEFLISTDLRIILSASGLSVPNDDFLSSFVKNDPASIFMSPVKAVKKLSGGCEIVYSDSLFKTNKITSLDGNGEPYLDSIGSLLKDIAANRKIYLQYSGGLDSSLLFLMLKDMEIPFTALHHDSYSFENDSELKVVRSMCEKYNIDLHIIKPSMDYVQLSCTESHPADISDFKTTTHSDTFSYETLSFGNDIVLNGQGGDSLFVQNPSEKVGFDLLRRGKFITAYTKMNDLSMLKNRSFSDMIKKNSLSALGVRSSKAESISRHPFTDELDPRSAKFDYYVDLLSMMERMPLRNHNNYQSYSPILSTSSIISFLSDDYHRNFTDEYDRINIRNMLYNRFRDSVVYEKRKRSSVNVMHKFLIEQKEIIMHIINNTYLPKSAGLDGDSLRKSLNSNFGTRLDENTTIFLRLSSAYRYYNSLNMV
jgi:PP-loop superfamily ATP-utilizing enzyme